MKLKHGFLYAFLFLLLNVQLLFSQAYTVFFPFDGNVIGQSKESVLNRYEDTDLIPRITDTQYPGGEVYSYLIGMDVQVHYEFRPLNEQGDLGLFAVQLSSRFSEYPGLFDISLQDSSNKVLENLGEPTEKVPTQISFGIT